MAALFSSPLKRVEGPRKFEQEAQNVNTGIKMMFPGDPWRFLDKESCEKAPQETGKKNKNLKWV